MLEISDLVKREKGNGREKKCAEEWIVCKKRMKQ